LAAVACGKVDFGANLLHHTIFVDSLHFFVELSFNGNAEACGFQSVLHALSCVHKRGTEIKGINMASCLGQLKRGATNGTANFQCLLVG
jgi:hypothetical protein